MTSYYQDRIKALHPNLTECECRHVEAWLRLEYGTLDGLYADEFKKITANMAEVARILPDESEELAQSYGL